VRQTFGVRSRVPSRADHILKPMGKPSTRYYLLLVTAGAVALWFFLAWGWQLRYGLVVTGLADWGTSGGVPWGIYIGLFIWWVGISHGGILISAGVRLFKLRVFYPVARLAELLTIGALSIAGLFIIIDLGRPDRVVTSVIRAYATTVHTSPLIWDVTVITLYFVLTATYLLLTIRHDIYHLGRRLPSYFAPLYRLLTHGYKPEEDKKEETKPEEPEKEENYDDLFEENDSDEPEEPSEEETRACPQCGALMYRQGRTWTCENCGYSYVE